MASCWRFGAVCFLVALGCRPQPAYAPVPKRQPDARPARVENRKPADQEQVISADEPDRPIETPFEERAADPPVATTCPAAQPTGQACVPAASPCSYGKMICTCEPPCRGAYMGPEPNRYTCREKPNKRCPGNRPKHGDACRPVGLQCRYGTCGGANARCISGKWDVLEWGPPPSAPPR